MQLYDAPNCDYEPPTNFQQNFGNPYDCPEGFYNASMMSSVGYSQVADYTGKPSQQLLPGQIIAQQAQQQQQQMMNQSSYGENISRRGRGEVTVITMRLQDNTPSPTLSTARTPSYTRAAPSHSPGPSQAEAHCPVLRKNSPRRRPRGAATTTASMTATPPRRATSPASAARQSATGNR